MVKKILISQPRPTSEKSPYYDIEKQFGVSFVFRPFFKVEGLSSKEFRQQKISILDHTAIVFTSRNAIDHFFRLAKELRLTIPDTMKYFCITETVALYLVPLSSVHNDSIATMLDAKKLQHTECVMYRTVSNDFTEEEKAAFDYDMLIFSSPTGMKALKKNFPDFEQGDIRIGAFGPATAKEVVAEGFRLDLEAPSKEYPSMTSALQAYLKKNK